MYCHIQWFHSLILSSNLTPPNPTRAKVSHRLHSVVTWPASSIGPAVAFGLSSLSFYWVVFLPSIRSLLVLRCSEILATYKYIKPFSSLSSLQLRTYVSANSTNNGPIQNPKTPKDFAIHYESIGTSKSPITPLPDHLTVPLHPTRHHRTPKCALKLHPH